MTTYRNAGAEPIWFRDDAGKHEVEPGETFAVIGDQHVPMVEAIEGVAPAGGPAKGRKVLVGERGPEILTPPKASTR